MEWCLEHTNLGFNTYEAYLAYFSSSGMRKFFKNYLSQELPDEYIQIYANPPTNTNIDILSNGEVNLNISVLDEISFSDTTFSSFNTTINYYSKNKNIVVDFPSFNSFFDFSIQDSPRYLFLPVTFYIENKAGHITFLLVDKKMNAIFLVDPNGNYNYFENKELYNKVTSVLERYFSTFNSQFGTSYTYVGYTNTLSFNAHSRNTKLYDKGNCLAWCCFLMQYLQFNSDQDFMDLIESLSSDSEQYHDMIYNYIANLMKEIINNPNMKVDEKVCSVVKKELESNIVLYDETLDCLDKMGWNKNEIEELMSLYAVELEGEV